MGFTYPRRRLRRLPALLAGLLVCLIPASASAPSPEPGRLLPAAAATLPLDMEWGAAYRLSSVRLAALGLTREQADLVWSRLGPQLPGQLNSGALSRQDLAFLSLPYCRLELLDRYRTYGQADPERSAEEVVTAVNIGLDRDFYSDIQQAEDPDSLTVLVNKYRALSQDYAPELTALDSKYGSGSLRPEAAAAFVQMADAARSEGVSLRSVSAYRSYQTQAGIYRRYVNQSGQTLADTFSARPGHSEHQTGLALDINVAQTSAHFENTPAFAWLQANCAQYGFLLRYPEDKQSVTGYRFEPWHYRYVGTEIAQACAEQGLTYEEYLARLPVAGAYQVPLPFRENGALDLSSAYPIPVSQHKTVPYREEDRNGRQELGPAPQTGI